MVVCKHNEQARRHKNFMRGDCMAKGKITALPSIIVYGDEKAKEFDSLTAEEKRNNICVLCKKVSVNMSDYYKNNRNDWRNFVSKMTA